MKKAILTSLLLLATRAFAAQPADQLTCQTAVSGLWSAAGTWAACGGTAPDANDIFHIYPTTHVILDSATSCATSATADCGIGGHIFDGGTLTMGPGALFLNIDCTDALSPANCLTVAGTFIGGPGQTLRLQVDDQPNLVVSATGRLIGHGARLTAGTVTGVLQDENTVTDVDLGFGLPRRDFEFQDTAAQFPLTTTGTQVWTNGAQCVDGMLNCYVVRFTSGDRRWRWYNTKAPTLGPVGNSIRVDYDSRGNAACETGGTTDITCTDGYGTTYAAGTACITATDGGACANAGTFIKGTSTAWSTNIHKTLGSRFYCTAGGSTVGSTIRIKRVISDTSAELASSYSTDADSCGSGGAAAYTIIDDNQPWPFEDHSEHLKAGDGYEIIQPFSLSAATNAGAEPDGSSILISVDIIVGEGGLIDFRYATLNWMSISLNGNNSVKRFLDNEIVNAVGASHYNSETMDDFQYARNVMIRSHPQCTTDECHGLTVSASTSTSYRALNLDIHDNRFEYLADDAVYLSTATTDGQVRDNVIKFIGVVASSNTTDCIDTNQAFGSPSSPHHNDLQFYNNICMNSGGASPSGIIMTVGQSGRANRITATRNYIANIQTGYGVSYGAPGGATSTDYAASQFSVIGNAIRNTGRDGVLASHVVIGNDIRNWGLQRDSAYGGITLGTRSVVGNLTVPLDETLTTGGPYPGLYEPPESGYPASSTIIYDGTISVTDNVFYGHSRAAKIGNAAAALAGNPSFTYTRNLTDCFYNLMTGAEYGLLIDLPSARTVTATRSVFTTCNGTSSVGLQRTSGTLVENNNLFTGNTDHDGGFTLDGTDLTGAWLAWNPLALSYDRIQDIGAMDYGPRAVGAARHPRVWPQLLTAVQGTSQSNITDSDGDGIVDLYDNCDLTVNPLQLDTDADGKGNRCDAA